MPVAGDYDGDGTDDVAVFQPSTGTWLVRNQRIVDIGVPATGRCPVITTTTARRTSRSTGRRPASGSSGASRRCSTATSGISRRRRDYNGDGKMDVAVYRPSTRTMVLKDSSPSSSSATIGDIPGPADARDPAGDRWRLRRRRRGRHRGPSAVDKPVVRAQSARGAVRGLRGTCPVPADYNGDRRMDVAVYRPSTGHWYARHQVAVQFGDPGDKPMPRDYNGDGLMDVAVYRPSTGYWYIRNQFTVQFGDAGDVPLPGDYNGDRVADVAVYCPSSGQWFVRNQFTTQFGDPGDIPVPADYNGDGKTDVAVYRPSTGDVVRAQPVRGAVRRWRRRGRAGRLRRRRRDGHRCISAVDGPVVRAESVYGAVRRSGRRPDGCASGRRSERSRVVNRLFDGRCNGCRTGCRTITTTTRSLPLNRRQRQ